MSVTSNLLASKPSAVYALYGPDHQVTMAETAPARTAAASSSQPALTASQRRLVMLCVQANWFVPVSSSLATSGAPQNRPGSSGTADVAVTSVVKTGLLRERFRLPHELSGAHLARAECHTHAACSPLISSATASAASSATASALWKRYCRQVTQVIGPLLSLTGGRPRDRRLGRCPGSCSRARSPPGPVPRRPRRGRSPGRSV